ncbi:stomatin-like protein 1 [Engraulis encrasicolus]|uniref:stomatin-like protein 1 n=1 Tax=Engraulis encrasicolus TaxID=184585 RepID=UPI002FCED16C
MFGGSNRYKYDVLPQKDPFSHHGPGLYTTPSDFQQARYGQKGHSFDYVPRITENDFTDRSQGCLSRLCHLIVIFLVGLCTCITFPVSGWFVLKVVPNYERIVFFRLGRIRPPQGPGVVLVLPWIDQWQRVDLRTRAFNIPPCKIHTRDGGLVSVGADIQFRIWSPVMSVVAVQDLNSSTRLTAQNAMTQSLSKKTVREIQTEKLKLGDYLGMDINELTKPWGLEVDRVELTLESVLKGPDGVSFQGHPGSQVVPTSASAAVPGLGGIAGLEGLAGLEGMAGPMQQLAMQFLGNMSNMTTNQSPLTGSSSVTVVDEVGSGQRERRPAVSSAEELLEAVKLVLCEGLVSTVGACYQLHITSPSGHSSSYYLDLSQGSGACGPGSLPRGGDVELNLSEADLLAMFQGALKPMAAYACGRLRVQGDLNVAMRLEELVKALKGAGGTQSD